MRILLADDQPKVRSALRVLLGQQPDVQIVGEAGSAEQLLAQIKVTRPDLLLFDWNLPGLSSNGRFSGLRSLYPEVKMIALSGRPDMRQAALTSGADAFVSKVDPPDRLLAAVLTIRNEINEEML